jgi:hypothetical protein
VKAFVVSVNGRKICTAGIGPNGVLSTILHWVGGGPRRPPGGTFGSRRGAVGQARQRSDLGNLSWKHPLGGSAGNCAIPPDHPFFVPGQPLDVTLDATALVHEA